VTSEKAHDLAAHEATAEMKFGSWQAQWKSRAVPVAHGIRPVSVVRVEQPF
jgi:hypothetical protein